MKESKRITKSEQIIRYEEQIFNEAQQFAQSKAIQLENIGLQIYPSLLWNYLGELETYSVRPKLIEKYLCMICIDICKKEENPEDLDLHCINFHWPITAITKGIWLRFLNFQIIELEDFYNRVEEMYNNIIREGYDVCLSKYFPSSPQ